MKADVLPARDARTGEGLLRYDPVREAEERAGDACRDRLGKGGLLESSGMTRVEWEVRREFVKDGIGLRRESGGGREDMDMDDESLLRGGGPTAALLDKDPCSERAFATDEARGSPFPLRAPVASMRASLWRSASETDR